MVEKLLQNYVMSEGLRGRVFYGTVGGKNREYTPLKLGYLKCPRYVTSDENYFEASLLVRLIGDDIPKFIKKKRAENTTNEESYDYNISLGDHLQDRYVRDLKNKSYYF